MTVMRSDHSVNLEGLATRLTGTLVLPQDAVYDEARQIWSTKVNKRPAALVRCMNVQDVIEAVQWARIHGMPLSVRGGGHDYAGRIRAASGSLDD
jgi:FAD/FMN-containing dehydrogenase